MIISRNLDYQQEGCLVFNDLKTAFKKAAESTDEIFIIGGSDLYKAILPMADTIYLTLINRDFEGDTFFPEIDLNEWSEVTREDIKDDPDTAFSYSFLKLEKTNPSTR
jgi:dihydrofolate reductase